MKPKKPLVQEQEDEVIAAESNGEPAPEITFEQFELDPRCMSVLRKKKITVPTPVQAQTIPLALEGRDVVGIAQTGTGKTLAFVLPALTRLAAGRKGRNAMLVLVPTRELALQVNSVFEEIGRALGVRSICIYGGVGLEQQARALRRGCNVIVATPGRLLDHMGRGNVAFKQTEILVLDEADRMLDMGFLPDIRKIMHDIPESRQTLMYSATFPTEIERLAQDMLHDPERIEVGSIAKPVDMVRQVLYTVQADKKNELLVKLLEENAFTSALVFMRTKSRTERVAKALHHAGFKAQAIHGDRSQKQRQQALDGFRSGKYPILVATDVAARGLDVDGISHVINFDIPVNSDDYIHRIGRTARANTEGDAITFVSPQDAVPLESIEKALGRNLPRTEWDGAVPVLSLFHEHELDKQKSKHAPRHRGRGLFRRR